MKTQLYQKKYPEYKKYTITDDYLVVEFKTQTEFHQFNVNYEKIGFEVQILRDVPSSLVIGLSVSLVLNVFLFLLLISDIVESKSIIRVIGFGFIGGFGALFHELFKYRYLKIIKNSGSTWGLHFFYNKKQQKEVDEFIELLKEAKRN